MCQPLTLSPAGGGIHQSASGTATAAIAPMTRERIARFCGRASSVSGRASSSCGAPTRARCRRSSVSASEVATRRPISGRSRTSCSNRSRGRRQTRTSVIAWTVAVRLESRRPISPNVPGALTWPTSIAPSGAWTAADTLAALEEEKLVRLGALACDLGACFDVDRLERAGEAREAHAIEIAEVRNESEESLERVIVIVGHGARRLAPRADPFVVRRRA